MLLGNVPERQERMREIRTDDAPDSIGPFSQAIESDGTVYVSGQGPIDPESGNIVGTDPQTQTRRTIENVSSILAAADLSLDDVVKTTVYLTDMDVYDDVNEEYETHFESPYPARSAVEVERLPVDILVEIEVVADRSG